MATERKNWASMTAEERAASTAARVALGRKAMATGEFPPSIRADSLVEALAGHMLYPVGGTERGSVSYKLAPVKVTINGRECRLNAMSFSILGTHDGGGTLTAPEGTEGW